MIQKIQSIYLASIGFINGYEKINVYVYIDQD